MTNELMDKIQYKIGKDELMKRCRKRDKVYKRAFLYNLMFNHDIQIVHIARLFNRNHASIIHALRTYSNLISTKDKELNLVLSDYFDFFEQYDINKIRYSIRDDVRNATTSRDLTVIRRRLDKNLYHDLKSKKNGGK